MKWKAIVFDRDGTLFDSLPVILQAFNYGIEPFTSKRPTPEAWFEAFGPAEPEVMGVFIPAEHKAGAYDRFFQYYRDHFHEIALFPGVRELLQRIHDSGSRIALFTGAGRETAEYCLKQQNVLQYFDELITGDSVLRPKPDPEGILKAMMVLNAGAAETLVVGDAGADVLAGQRAGATSALARWSGFIPPHDLPSNPDYTFTNVMAFERFLFH
ncbi:HAD-IA family hydrolase [bacterium]|nr:HAD-IA family hydrolase [bacterium]